MADCKELQAFGNISSEVDDSHVKIILSSQCIKAQKFLVDRLKRETERQKVLCRHVSGGNSKLDAEIKHAELELKSMLIACDTLKNANTDIRKEFLLAKERMKDTEARIEIGENKYEDLWLQCKKRYETIPFVQKWFQKNNQSQMLKNRIASLDEEMQCKDKEIKAKRVLIENSNKKLVIELAEYLVKERPKIMQFIATKKAIIEKMSLEMTERAKEQNINKQKEQAVTKLADSRRQSQSIVLMDGDWPSLTDNFNNDDDTLMMPRLKMMKGDLESISMNIHQMKKLTTPPNTEKMQIDENTTTGTRDKSFVSSLFSKSYLTSDADVPDLAVEPDNKTFKQKKLIHILANISLDKKETKEIIESVNKNEVKPIDVTAPVVGGNASAATEEVQEEVAEQVKKNNEPTEMDIDILIPPTPFMDMSKGTGMYKKRVSFELPVIQEEPAEDIEGQNDNNEANNEELELTANSQQMDVSIESYDKMKEKVLKEHKLDLSPEFVYTKNSNIEDKIIKSKFFKKDSPQKSMQKHLIHALTNEDTNIEKNTESNETPKDKVIDKSNNNQDMTALNIMSQADKGDDGMMGYNEPNEMKSESVTGFLFTHGPHGLPESLDVSISTTGYEDGDADFTNCMGLNASLLLSPKADDAESGCNDNAIAYSQEVPNFLSGLKKSGFSFFGGSTSNTPAANNNNNKDNENNGAFNFNFGGEEKKTRSSLFSMFH